MQTRILITGGAGFIGSSLAIFLKKKYPHYSILSLDNLARKGSELNLPRLSENGIEFIRGDVRNKKDLENLGKEITTIIDAAAEPSVLSGINDSPEYLFDTNLGGTFNCLMLASKCKSNFIFLSMSRVYPIEKLEKIAFIETDSRFELSPQQELSGISPMGINEEFSLQGYRSFYGTTKLSSELLVEEFRKFYDIQTVVNRCGVITGPWQMGKVDQGVAVLWVARHFWKQKLSYLGYGGKGKQIRDFLHIDDLCLLIDFQLHNMKEMTGKTFNVGGGTDKSISLLELTAICQEITGNKVDIQEVKENRKADVRIYISDNSAVAKATGWQPKKSIHDMVSDIYQWIKQNELILRPILSENTK